MGWRVHVLEYRAAQYFIGMLKDIGINFLRISTKDRRLVFKQNFILMDFL